MTVTQKDDNIIVHISQKFKQINIDTTKLKSLAKNICKRFNIKKATVSIAIVASNEIIEINRKFLKKNSDTDVISFDLSDEAASAKLFEVVVNGQKAVEEAKLRGHSALAELALYITHGLLHNLGFDDSRKDLAKKMHDMENEILQQQGFGLVYNSGSDC